MSPSTSPAPMSTMSQPGAPRFPDASQDLSMRSTPDAVQVRFLFEQPDPNRVRGALASGLISHVVFVGLLVLLAAILPERVYQAVLPEQLSDKIVWLAIPGPGGGGGG